MRMIERIMELPQPDDFRAFFGVIELQLDTGQETDAGQALIGIAAARDKHPEPEYNLFFAICGLYGPALLLAHAKDPVAVGATVITALKATLPLIPVDERIVHALCGGQPACYFTEAEPRDWPPSHTWANFRDIEHITCPTCKEQALALKGKEATPPTREPEYRSDLCKLADFEPYSGTFQVFDHGGEVAQVVPGEWEQTLKTRPLIAGDSFWWRLAQFQGKAVVTKVDPGGKTIAYKKIS